MKVALPRITRCQVALRLALYGGLIAGALAVVGADATAASAPSEQWLQYHTTREERSYRWLDLTTNAPPSLSLPKKLNGQPYFARWTTPLDSNGARWICFDRTRRSGPWNRVFIDSNGNGRLDDEPPIDAASLDSYSAHFDPLRFVFKGEDGPLVYHLALRFMKYDDNQVRLLAASGCYYDGKVNLAGKKRLVTLIDGNVNGVFNDIHSNPSDCDRLGVEGEKSAERFLGRLVEIDNQLFQVEAARDGAFIKLRKAENVALGQVRVPETLSEFVTLGEMGHFIRKPVKGQFTLPVGKYRVHGWTLERKDDKGAAWKLSGSGFSGSASFEVAAAIPATVEVGEPVQTALTATESRGTVSFGLRLKGWLGESVDIQKDNQRPRAPQLVLASTGGSFRDTRTFEYG